MTKPSVPLEGLQDLMTGFSVEELRQLWSTWSIWWR
jgi:hypothetical protein